MFSNPQDDNLKIVHEADNETEETITHMNNNSIVHHPKNGSNNQPNHQSPRYPQAKYNYLEQNNFNQNEEDHQVGSQMLKPVTKKYVKPTEQFPVHKSQSNDIDDNNFNERDRKQNKSGEDELQQELRKTQSSLQRLKKQNEFVTNNNKFYSSKPNDTLQYHTFRDKFLEENNNLRHNLNTPEEKPVRTPNNYKRVKKIFYDTSKPFYPNNDRDDKTLDEAVTNNLEERNMIDRIQRDIDREKQEFLNKYQTKYLDEPYNSKYDYAAAPEESENPISSQIKKKKPINPLRNDSGISDDSLENKNERNKLDYSNPDQILNHNNNNTQDHYPHKSNVRNEYPYKEDDDHVQQYDHLVYPESYKQFQEKSSPRQITLASYKDIYLERQNKELFVPRNVPKNIPLEEEEGLNQLDQLRPRRNNETEIEDLQPQMKNMNEAQQRKDILLKSKLQDEPKSRKNSELTYNFKTNETQMQMHYLNNNKQEPLGERDLINKLSSTYNVGQSIKDYKKQKEALKSTIRKRLTPSTDEDNFSLKDKADLDQETPRATPKGLLSKTGSVRGTPIEFNSNGKYNPSQTELDIDKIQNLQRGSSTKQPSQAYIAEIPLSTRNSQRRDFYGNPINTNNGNNNDYAPRMPSSTRNIQQPNQRYSSQPRPSSKVYSKQMDNFINYPSPSNPLEKANSKNLDETGLHLRTRIDTQGGVYPRNLLSQSVKKTPNTNLDLSNILNNNNQDAPLEMQSARIPRKNNDIRTQSVHMTPRESTKEKIFKQLENPSELSQKKDLKRHFLEPQIDDFALIDKKNNHSQINSLNNSRIDSDFSQKSTIQKPILYPSRRLPSINKGKNDMGFNISKCCHDKSPPRSSDFSGSRKYTYGQNYGCTKQVKNAGQQCIKCPVCTSQLKVERIGQF
ncbi:hypothetical protein ABPG74_001353 [Tetrahymena malaccensis]